MEVLQRVANIPDVCFSLLEHAGGLIHTSMWFSQGQADPAQPTSLSQKHSNTPLLRGRESKCFPVHVEKKKGSGEGRKKR